MKKEYQHFCPLARVLEVIGEKWSLLIVRDLLRGAQRFTDLQRYLHSITPRQLSERLKKLEDHGIILRETSGYEVWYSLSPKGEDLRESIEALLVWGIRHGMEGSLREQDRICPEQTLYALSVWFNRNGIRLSDPTTWLLRWGKQEKWALVFDGKQWSQSADSKEADLVLRVDPRDWVSFLGAEKSAKLHVSKKFMIEGPARKRKEFLNTVSRVASSSRAARRQK